MSEDIEGGYEREPDAKDKLYEAYNSILDDTRSFIMGMLENINKQPEVYKHWDLGDFLDEFRNDWCGK